MPFESFQLDEFLRSDLFSGERQSRLGATHSNRRLCIRERVSTHLSANQFGEQSWLYWNVGRSWLRTLSVSIALMLAIAGTVFFASRAGRRAGHIHAEHEPIRAWMSIPFIAHTHHVPASVLFQAIGVQAKEPHDRRPVRRLAHELNRPVPELIDQLQQAIDAAEKQSTAPSR